MSAGLVLAADLSATFAGSLSLGGGVTDNGFTITKSGAGSLTISGAQSYAAGSAIVQNAGALTLNSDAGSSSSVALSLTATAGVINLFSQQHLASFTLSNASASVRAVGQYIYTHAFSLTGASTLDLQQNDLIVDYTGASPLPAIRAALLSGFNQGAWNGSGIIDTSAASHPGMTLGYAEASDVLGLTNSQTAAFDGQTIDSTTTLVRYTHYGDANLDGKVDVNDFNLFLDGFVNSSANSWSQGDFTYDGKVDLGNDFSLFLSSYLEAGGSLGDLAAALQTSPLSAAQKAAFLPLVPEPGATGLLLIAACGTFPYRKRSRGASDRVRAEMD
jgi:autotransporter-associated beta strand protein